MSIKMMTMAAAALAAVAGFGVELETARWQAAIDEVAAKGGGRVVVPAGVHPVGQLDLRSNVELHLERGAVLEGAAGMENYRIVTLPYSEGTWSAVVAGFSVTNVAITGEGEINGRGERFSMDFRKAPKGICTEGLRPRGVFFSESKDIRLEDFTLRDAGCWSIVFKCCDGIVARRVKVDSHAHHNNDGFDIEARNVLIEDCDVDGGDDGICIKSNTPGFTVENITVRRCIARSHCNGMKLGTASHGTMRNIRFENCRAEAPRRDFPSRVPGKEGRPAYYRKGFERFPNGVGLSAICVECVDGGTVEDVTYDGIEVSGFEVPIFVRGGTRLKRTCGIPPSDRRVLRNITIRNVRGRAESAIPSSISGVEGCIPKDVLLENVSIVCRGDAEDRRPVSLPGPEFAGKYPEATMFRGIRLPAFGLFVDRAERVRLRNVAFRMEQGMTDARQPVFFSPTAVDSGSDPTPVDVPELLRTGDGREVKTAAEWEAARRPELLGVFQREVYGVRPVERPPVLRFETVREDPETLGGTAVLKVVRIVYGGPYGERDFTAVAFFPKTASPAPVFVYVGLQNDGLDSHRMPGDGQEWPKQTEERWPVRKILARGFATVSYRVTDVAPDDDFGFRVGAYTCFEKPGSRTAESWAALSAWAWGASRVADWLETEPRADASRLAVAGLSRCGKTALWAAATDRRFGLCCSSGAGCCGDKLNHVEQAPVGDEHVARILRFRQWFCRNFDRYAGHDLDMPFDQHELLALIAPRALCIAAASEDDGAGPRGQFLSAVLASPAWELYGKRGLVAPDGFPAVERPLQEGTVSFHLRKGGHDLVSYDWNRFMDFAQRQGWGAPPRPVPRPQLVKRLAEGGDVIGIVHWGLNTYTDREWGFGDEDPALLDPKAFDADQIVGACRAAGIRGLVVVAKHHDGFCLWPTKTTGHNISKSPFRGGRGDYVKEMSEACRRAGLRFGVYVSPWDRNSADYATAKYVDTYHAQIRELLGGGYGEVFEMWFDGANGGDGYYGGARERRKIGPGYYRFKEVYAFVREMQPTVCIFGGESSDSDFRWPGNEKGLLDPESRATICPVGGYADGKYGNPDYKTYINTGCVEGRDFRMCEADFPLRKGWFYHEKERGTTRSAAYLMKLYLSSVGNGGIMNIGVAPTKDGVLCAEDVRALKGFGEIREAFFADEVTETGRPFNVVVMSEDISQGELVDGWDLKVDGRTVLAGRSVGSKRIRVLPEPVTARSSVAFTPQSCNSAGRTLRTSCRRYYVNPELAKCVLAATTASGETDTALYMTGRKPHP